MNPDFTISTIHLHMEATIGVTRITCLNGLRASNPLCTQVMYTTTTSCSYGLETGVG